MTIAQLLSHTAGLASEADGPWWERTPGHLRPELASILGPEPGRHPAGRLFHYSNPGYALLGALVGELRGQAWHEVLRQEILEPLGMAAHHSRAAVAARARLRGAPVGGCHAAGTRRTDRLDGPRRGAVVDR